MSKLLTNHFLSLDDNQESENDQGSDQQDQESEEEDQQCLIHIYKQISTAQSTHETQSDPMQLQLDDKETVGRFLESSCHCQLHLGGPCSTQFTSSYVLSARTACLDLPRNELDMVLLGQLMACTNQSEGVVDVAAKHKAAERKRTYTTYLHQGKLICSLMFRFLHAVGELK